MTNTTLSLGGWRRSTPRGRSTKNTPCTHQYFTYKFRKNCRGATTASSVAAHVPGHGGKVYSASPRAPTILAHCAYLCTAAGCWFVSSQFHWQTPPDCKPPCCWQKWYQIPVASPWSALRDWAAPRLWEQRGGDAALSPAARARTRTGDVMLTTHRK